MRAEALLTLRQSLPRTSFYFVRHGQTDANKAKIIQGHLDHPLNEEGISQARAVARMVALLSCKSLCASDLDRAVTTARIIATEIGHSAPVDCFPELKERHFGIWQGRHRDEMELVRVTDLADIEGGEDYTFFIQRITAGLHKALQQSGPVVIVSHGGVFRAMGHLLGFEPIKAENAALYKLTPQTDSSGWIAERITE
ncbi:MAG: histidine phosphatase family protein [Proteobacteria bacterium]|nr:histidine phosphatase family protein [Pseudomonadota bacterium]